MTTKATSPEYFLTPHTFMCVTAGSFVVLDLHNDNYSYLEKKYTAPVSKLLGLPDAAPSTGGAPAASNPEITDLVQNLLKMDLLTTYPDKGKKAAFLSQPEAPREMPGYLHMPKIRAGHIFRFFKALIVTRFMLRFRSMEQIVARVKIRKERHRAKRAVETDAERINRLVEIYKILKPLFVTVKDNCLFDTFFLIEFLAPYRIFPDAMFGVRLNEFYAHAWVQDGNMIYDDFIDRTCLNQPIMRV